MIDSIIFDMDGVIVDSELYWKKTEPAFFRKIINGWNDQAHKEIVGMSVPGVYDLLKKKFGLKMEKNHFLKSYDNMAIKVYENKVSLLPNVLSFIKGAKAKNFNLAIASSAPMSWIDMVCQRFKLSSYFDEIISADDVDGKGKPAPDIYLYAAKHMQKRPDECIVIEDSMNGIFAAKAANMKCIGIRNGFNDEQDLSQADMIIKDFKELSSCNF